MAQLKHLFQPLRIGSMEVKNRIVVPAMEPGFGIDDDGCVLDQHTEFVVERARSEPGMIVSGAAAVHPSGVSGPQLMNSIHLWDEHVYPSVEKMVKAVHAYDVRFGAQLNHGGLNHLPEESLCPTVIPEMVQAKMPVREVTTDELKEIVAAFGFAAARCAAVGFDFVEIHGAHSYLINEFLTPYYNRRTDEYGGSFENRVRFLLEVVREVRRQVGNTFPLGVRLPGDDFIPDGGWNVEDLCLVAPVLEKEGVDYISVSQAGAAFGSLHVNIAPMYEPQGAFFRFAEQVKRHVSIPVATVGRIKNAVAADQLIGEGKADLVAMARAQVADPELAAKARRGDVADIRPCLAECLGCIEGILRYGEASCAVNARVGREYLVKDIEGEKKDSPRRVLVAGAGCAGLEAARRAAFAGHRVLVCESRGWIGGQLRLAARMPCREEIGDIIPWFERQLNKLGVEVRLNTTVDQGLLDEYRPEVVIAATGSLPEVPLGYVNGLGNVRNLEIIMADELVEEERLTGDTVLVVGGNQIGLQIADYLATRGKTVHLVERGTRWAPKMANNDRHYLIGRVLSQAVTTYRRVHEIEILPDDEVWLVNAKGREALPGIETMVLASDRRPNIFLAEAAEKMGIECHIVGDASGVTEEGQGTIMAAITAGYDAGRMV